MKVAGSILRTRCGMFTDFREKQPLKAPAPMKDTLLGMYSECKSEQSLNASLPMALIPGRIATDQRKVKGPSSSWWLMPRIDLSAFLNSQGLISAVFVSAEMMQISS